MARESSPEIIGNNNLKRVTEDARDNVTGGDLDVRNGQDVFKAFDLIEGIYGTFSINAQGQWTYTLDNSRAVTQALNPRDNATFDWFTAQTADSSLSKIVVVLVRGAADEEPAPTTEVSLVGIPDSGA